MGPTLVRAIQEVNTDLLNGLQHGCARAPVRETTVVPFLAGKQGIGAWRFMGRRLRWHQPSGPTQYDPLGPLASENRYTHHQLALRYRTYAPDLDRITHARTHNGSFDCQNHFRNHAWHVRA